MKILHPTDFSRTAEKARTLAFDVMRRTGGSLHIVHVQQRFETATRGPLGPSLDTLDPELVARVEEERKVEVRRLKDRLAHLAGAGATHELRWGAPLPELLDASKAYELVVMGAHGANRLDAAFLGGVAGRLVRRSQVPVLTVRSESEASRLGRVLVATDFGDASRHAWHHVEGWARHGIELLLAHVIDDARYRDDLDYSRRATEALTEMAHGHARRHVLRAGDPVRELPALAHELGADAICVGVRRRAGAAGLLLGSRADALLRSSPVPILSVPHVSERSPGPPA